MVQRTQTERWNPGCIFNLHRCRVRIFVINIRTPLISQKQAAVGAKYRRLTAPQMERVSWQEVAIVGMGGRGTEWSACRRTRCRSYRLTTSPDKIEDAKRFGAKEVVIKKTELNFSKLKHVFDRSGYCSLQHDLNPFIPLLKRDATYCRVGVGKVADSSEIGQMNLVLYRNALAGSNTGGIQETQDMVDFCALNKIKPEITKVSMNGIDDAWKKVFDKQARYRFVIDLGGR